jgi:hypothetical protein
MHGFGLQIADAHRLRDKGMTLLCKLDRTDAVAIEWAGFGHNQPDSFAAQFSGKPSLVAYPNRTPTLRLLLPTRNNVKGDPSKSEGTPCGDPVAGDLQRQAATTCDNRGISIQRKQ